MRGRRARATLPVDVRAGDGAQPTDGPLVEAVLDALPSPTVLLAQDGTVLLTNSVWRNAARFLDDERFLVGVGGDYFAMARLVRDDAATLAMIESVRALVVGPDELRDADPDLRTLRNLNTPEDYQAALEEWQAGASASI